MEIQNVVILLILIDIVFLVMSSEEKAKPIYEKFKNTLDHFMSEEFSHIFFNSKCIEE